MKRDSSPMILARTEEILPSVTVSLQPVGIGDELDDPALYLNRELTWLEFNFRVLHEAFDDRNPLLERLKFVAIVGSNLDEFYMKRVGGLMQQLHAGVRERTVDGRTPGEQIAECRPKVRRLERQQHAALAQVLSELKAHEIEIVAYERLDAESRERVRDYYVENIFPLVTPHAMSPAHPFPFVSNLSLNLLATLRYPDEDRTTLARVKVPVGQGVPRFLQVGDGFRSTPLEDVISNNLDLLFPGMTVEACELFRVTRNANTETDEDQADDLLAMIQSELRDRKLAPIVRLEVASGMDASRRGMLAAELGLNETTNVDEVEGMLALRDLMEIATTQVPALHDPPHHAADPPKLDDSRNIFHTIRDEKSILLHHPYESFAHSVQRFLREASEDPKVLAIKMTLYRSGPKIINLLLDAARNGKQVTVVVELKARFDEAANIRWARRLEEFGINVTYGVVGLKTHCKLILVVRRDYNGLRRYAHVGTGNYHPGTAKLYADLGLLTVDDEVGRDLTELFNYLTTGFKPKRKYRKLLVAPKGLKKAVLLRIEREIKKHSSGEPGLIQFKMNALEDVDVIKALYCASQAGVRVDLIVRDTCRLRPGVRGVSENIRVISLVGRFLEHGRIYYFRNGGKEEYFIGSADFMKRNLESRVETLVPVEDEASRADLRAILDFQLRDQRQVWEMQPDGSYVQRVPRDEAETIGSHAYFAQVSEQRERQASRLRKRRPRGMAKRR